MPLVKKPPETRYLIQEGTGRTYVWTKQRAARRDMHPHDPKNPDASRKRIVIYDMEHLTNTLRHYDPQDVSMACEEVFGKPQVLVEMNEQFNAPDLDAPATDEDLDSDHSEADTDNDALELPSLPDDFDPTKDELYKLNKEQIVSEASEKLEGAVINPNLSKKEMIVEYRTFEAALSVMDGKEDEQ